MHAIISNADLLRRIPPFSHLLPEQAENLANNLVKLRLKRGEVIFDRNSPSGRIYILLAGCVNIIGSNKSGREVLIEKIRAVEIINASCIVDPQPYFTTACAEICSDVLSIDNKYLLHCARENEQLAFAIMRQLANRVRLKERKIISMALLDVTGRVVNALIELAITMKSGDMRLNYHVSRTEIAKMAGASREMVSRVFKDLSAQGLILIDDQNRLTIKSSLISLYI